MDPDPVRRVPNEDPGHNPDQDQLPRGHRVDHHPHHETLGLLSSVLPSLVDHHAVGGWGSDHCGLALAEVGDLSSYPLLAFLLVRARVQVRGAGGPSVCRVDPVHLVRAAGHTGARDGTLAPSRHRNPSAVPLQVRRIRSTSSVGDGLSSVGTLHAELPWRRRRQRLSRRCAFPSSPVAGGTVTAGRRAASGSVHRRMVLRRNHREEAATAHLVFLPAAAGGDPASAPRSGHRSKGRLDEVAPVSSFA